MQTISLGKSPLRTSRLAYGLWRVAGIRGAADVTPDIRAAGRNAIVAVYEAGYTLFDNADIYCEGEAERFLGAAFKEVSGLREHVLVATKCGVRRSGEPKPDSPARYDFSKEHIIKSCEESLKRLCVEVIDLYMLHRRIFWRIRKKSPPPSAS